MARSARFMLVQVWGIRSLMERASRIVSILLGLAVMVSVVAGHRSARLRRSVVGEPQGAMAIRREAASARRRQRSPSPRLPRLRRKPQLPCPRQSTRAGAASGNSPARTRVSADAACGATRRRLTRAGSTAAGRRQDRANCRRDCQGPRQDRRRRAANHDRSSTTASPCATAARCNRASVVIKLAGIAARDADATCKETNGKAWPCGAAAKAALARLIHARAVTCEVPKQSAAKDVVARCSVAETDLSTWMVRQGWATPKDTERARACPKRRRPPNRTSSGSGAARSERRGRSLMRRVLI